jgi:indolepyruvate ferredoxin oxidoreductase alpha subunit
VDLAGAVQGCGVRWVRTADPFQFEALLAVLKEAVAFSRAHGPAVVISRAPCLLDKGRAPALRRQAPPLITEECDGCGFCVQHFECPAIALNAEETRAAIDPLLCSGCGVCCHVCPKQSIQPAADGSREGGSDVG